MQKREKKIGHHISSNSTVYLAAPAGVRPITKFARKKEEEKEDEKKTVKKKKDINENKTSKFRGITNENCLVWLQASKRRGETEKYETVLEFVDEAITKLFKTINFRRLPKSVLLDLVKRNSLIVNEMELFRAIISWAETRARQILQLKYQEKKEMDKNKIKVKISPQRLKKLLTPFLPFIRFPIMQTREIISIIYPMNLLSQEQIRDLCSFCTIRDEVENSESKNTVLFKKKQAYLDVLSKKNTLKEFIFTHRNGMHVVLWHWDRDYKYELCKTAREAKAIMQSLPGGASRAWYTPYFKVSKKWFCNSTWEKNITTFYNKYLKNYSRGERIQYTATCTQGSKYGYDLELSFFYDEVFGTAKISGVQIPITGTISENELSWIEDVRLTSKYTSRPKSAYTNTIILKSKSDVFKGCKLEGECKMSNGTTSKITITMK